MHLLLFTNEFPDDDVVHNLRRLHSHAKTGSHAYLADFLRQATYAIRDEIRQLSHIDQALVPHIESIVDLCGHPQLRRSCLAGSIDSVLLVVLELGCVIG
jgi:monodictyphenone polyketide synthase